MAAPAPPGWPALRVTRRGIQLTLGLLWLLDGALQLQPSMFGHGFATRVIAPAGQGQPGFVAAAVSWAAWLIGAHPAGWDAAFAAAQLLIGAAVLIRPLARLGLAASIGWALGIWYLGEGLGGIASGHADLLTGAPGAVLLYAVLALAAWPQPAFRDGPGLPGLMRMRADAPPAGWVPAAWAVLWAGSALLRALPGQNSAAGLAGEIGASAAGAPAWLAHLGHSLAAGLSGTGLTVITALIVLQAGIAAAGLRPGRARRAAGWAGIAVSATFWIIGQDLGYLYSGQATDPSTAPLVALLALALLGCQPSRPARGTIPATPSIPQSELHQGAGAAPAEPSRNVP